MAVVLLNGSIAPGVNAQSIGLCSVPLPQGSADESPAFVPPPGGTSSVESKSSGTACTLRWATGVVYAEAEADEKGRPTVVRFYDELGRKLEQTFTDYDETGEGELEESENAPVKCDTSTFRVMDTDWAFSPITWRLNTGSLPSYLKNTSAKLSATVQAVREGHIAWESNINPCGVPDGSSLNFTYSGTTTRKFAKDGANIVDYGETVDALCGSGGIACTRQWFSSTTGEVVEADTRIDEDWTWSTVTSAPIPSGQHDLWGAMAHETGHVAGFDHVADVNQIMRQGLPATSKFKRKLSLGEALGNNSKY